MSVGRVDILVVDDNDDDLILATEALNRTKRLAVVGKANDGQEALDFLRRKGKYATAQRPHIVLLDVNMPRMNGFEVLREIKADPALCCLPVVMLTTSMLESEVSRCYSMGAAGFITKPVGFEKLLSTMMAFGVYWTHVSRVPESEENL